jgi:hypothetical protein
MCKIDDNELNELTKKNFVILFAKTMNTIFNEEEENKRQQEYKREHERRKFDPEYSGEEYTYKGGQRFKRTRIRRSTRKHRRSRRHRRRTTTRKYKKI